MLLNVDGLHENWENGIASDWENGNIRNENNLLAPFAITILNRNNDTCSEISTACEKGTHISQVCKKYTIDGKRIVSKMPLTLFKRWLVNHFNIRFINNDIVWPRRLQEPKRY